MVVIWEKKTNPDFDVSMGSADGAEVSELIGLYMMIMLMKRFNKSMFGLYRDDGLMVIRGGGPDVDKQEGLKVTTECNASCVDFLDVVLDLKNDNTKPFIKPNANTKYVSVSSSHPPSILKRIPDGVSKRLSTISSSKDHFIQELPYYQSAMDKAGHKEVLSYTPMDAWEEKEKTNRGRGVIWFNSPWSNNIRTNVGAKFISLVRKHFPKSSPLHSIFNTKKLKVAYKTTTNMASLIKTHNKRILSNNTVDDTRKGCNCRDGVASCPMRGNCLDKSMVYKADVSTSRGMKHYYGQTFRTFKERFYGHQHDLRNSHKADSTTLSQFVWKMREQGEQPLITWSKVTSAKPYLIGGRTCQLCIAEKTEIAKDTSGSMLNRRRELMNKCLHKEPYKLSNFYSQHLQQAQQVDQDVHHDQLPLVNQDQLVHHDVQLYKMMSRLFMQSTMTR